MDKKLSWQAWEYKQTEKTADWYWAVVLITICITVVSVMLHDALFGILIVIATTLLVVFSIKAPRLFNVALDERGLTVDNDRYPFAGLESFWVDISDPKQDKIIFKSKKLIMPLIIIPLNGHEHLDARAFLLRYLPEQEMHEPLAHKIMEGLGF